VGNRAIVFALERLGFEVWAVPTIVLPHHPGHGPGERIVPDDSAFARLLQNMIEDRPAQIVGILSGYFATPGQVASAAALVRAVKAARPDARYLCDPVIGDAGKLYVGEPIAAAVRDQLLPLADIATPNAFECGWLANRPASTLPDLAAAVRVLPPVLSLVTSAPALMRGQIGNLLVEGSAATLFEHPALPAVAKGTGDLLAALLLGRLLQGHEPAKAAQRATASVFELATRTANSGSDELMLTAEQSALVEPRTRIGVRHIAL
jgi:pyridoxine kinase